MSEKHEIIPAGLPVFNKQGNIVFALDPEEVILRGDDNGTVTRTLKEMVVIAVRRAEKGAKPYSVKELLVNALGTKRANYLVPLTRRNPHYAYFALPVPADKTAGFFTEQLAAQTRQKVASVQVNKGGLHRVTLPFGMGLHVPGNDKTGPRLFGAVSFIVQQGTLQTRIHLLQAAFGKKIQTALDCVSNAAGYILDGGKEWVTLTYTEEHAPERYDDPPNSGYSRTTHYVYRGHAEPARALLLPILGGQQSKK